MNILYLCEKTDGSDGWSRYTGDLKKNLETRVHKIYLCERKSHIPIPHPLQMLTRPFLAPILAWKLRKIIKEFQPDIIHITVEPYALIVPFLPKQIQKKIVLTLHGSYAVRPLFMWQTRWLACQYYKRIPRFITVSHYTKKRVIEELEKMGKQNIAIIVNEHTTVIYNGVNIRPFLPPLPNPPPRGKGNIRTILHVGGIKPIKGVLETLTACAVYRDQFSSNFHLSIIGRYDPSDIYVKKVRARIAELHLENHVTLRGFVPEQELQKAYQSADLLLLPSQTSFNTFEGFGLVFLEANACGVPVIGPNDSGAAEAIHEGANGFRVDPTNPTQIAERMHWILNEYRIDPLHCREWAKRHDIEHAATQVENVYGSMTTVV